MAKAEFEFDRDLLRNAAVWTCRAGVVPNTLMPRRRDSWPPKRPCGEELGWERTVPELSTKGLLKRLLRVSTPRAAREHMLVPTFFSLNR